MTTLFRPLSYYKDVPPFTFPGADRFAAVTPPRGTWPAAGGGAGRTGRTAEPLVQDRFTLAWWAPLGAAERPDNLLLGAGHVVVEGAERRAIWTEAGVLTGDLDRQGGASLLDLEGRRLLVNELTGTGVYILEAQRESTVMLSAPGDGVTEEILQGPGALVLVTKQESPHGSARAVVETARLRDYAAVKNGVLYGVEPLAGIIREDDADVAAAAGKSGPVLATPAGVEWYDWQLRPRGQSPLSAHPLVLSVDEQDRACLLTSDGGWTHLQLLAPAGAPVFDLTLPVEDGPFDRPPLIAATGQIYLTSPQGIVALSPAGQVLWRKPASRSSGLTVPATLTANGILLVAGEALEAITSDGSTTVLWQPPAPLLTPPVLANELIYVATAEALFALKAMA